MVGFPSSGKTTRAREIQKYFTEQLHKQVVLISDNEIITQMNVEKNVLFLGKNIDCLDNSFTLLVDCTHKMSATVEKKTFFLNRLNSLYLNSFWLTIVYGSIVSIVLVGFGL